MKSLFNKFQRDVLGVAFFVGFLFIIFSLLSYSPTDPSFNSSGTGDVIKNYCGVFGSFVADIFYQLFGVSSWLIALSILTASVRLFKSAVVGFFLHRAFIGFSLVAAIGTLITLYFTESRLFSGEIRIGGLLGYLIYSALVDLLNPLGVGILLWGITLVLLVFYFDKSINEFYGTVKLIVYRLIEKLNISRPSLSMLSLKIFRKNSAIESSEPDLKIEDKSFSPSVEQESHEYENNDDEDYDEEKIEEETSKFNRIVKIFDRNDKSKTPAPKRPKREQRIENWEMPNMDLLDQPPLINRGIDEKQVRRNVEVLEDKLSQFSVKGKVVAVKTGPAITMYEYKPKSDVKISKITDLADDLSLALSSESTRIIAPLPGRDVVGIEVSNSNRETVYMRDVLDTPQFYDNEIKLPIILGKEANGSTKVVDLRKMPHLLVAGSTGSGKSVFLVSLISGLLFRHSPKTLKFIFVDPKQVDLTPFQKVPHLLMPPIREPKKAVIALKWAIKEMEKRYRSMAKFDSRGIEQFNEKVSRLSKSEIEKHEDLNSQIEQELKMSTYFYTPQPYICIVVEEFGDLMAVDKNNVEQAVIRLSQMARACGIHLILAMQSPRKDVVTGLIKTNIPGRISFKVATKMDSRIILDEAGAERLLAKGDMLFLAPGVAKPLRCHGCWVSDEEVSNITGFWGDQDEPEFDDIAMKMLDGNGGGYDLGEVSVEESDEYDERYDEVLAYVSTQKEVSASLLQRKFRLGYPRAARMIEVFEREGVVGPAKGSKPRQVLISKL